MAEEKTKEKTKTEEAVETLDLKRFLSSMRLDTEVSEPVPMLQDELQTIAEAVSDEDRFISGLAALLMNIDTSVGRFDKGMVQQVIGRIDLMVNDQIHEIMHQDQFKQIESNWRSLHDLILNTNFRADVMIDILDVTKEELYEDFEANAVDITGSALFNKVVIGPGRDTSTPQYRNALYHLLCSQTSCYRYWGQGLWTDYGIELCRRTRAILQHDF